MLNKIKAIFGLAVITGVAGFFAALQGADYAAAFGPSIGALLSGGVGYGVKESLPRIKTYLAKAFGVKLPNEAA